MNAINNINGIGNIARTSVYTLNKNGALLQVQETMVRKLVSELKNFDNIIYEICNEPYFGDVMMDWQHHIASIITETEKDLQTKHLISQNIANGSERIKDANRAVSVFNFHYASPPIAVAENYHLNKVIGDNETGFRGTTDSTYRREGWEFILAGGGLYNNLDYSFTAGKENGTFSYPATQPGGGSAALRSQLGFLKDFIHRFDFVRMRPDSTLIIAALPKKIKPYILSEPGIQYAVYIFGGEQVSLDLLLPPGNYDAEWVNPLTGQTEKKELMQHSGGNLTITSPPCAEDIALSILKVK